MRNNSVITRLLVFLFIFVVFWQIFKLWYAYTEKSDIEELVKNVEIQKVLITVYYEALCPDSRNFIIRQLLPTFDMIQDYVEVDLVPYGKAETRVVNHDYVFDCQHGEIECKANIVHACTINTIKEDSRKQLDIISCMIKNNIHPMDILHSCAGEMNEFKDIVNCSQTIKGRKLLMKYGEMTHKLNPKVSFIPTITLDHDLDNQILILKDLLHQVCKRIKIPPLICKS